VRDNTAALRAPAPREFLRREPYAGPQTASAANLRVPGRDPSRRGDNCVLPPRLSLNRPAPSSTAVLTLTGPAQQFDKECLYCAGLSHKSARTAWRKSASHTKSF